ncbi:MAG: hypothetical protein LW704_06015 [Cryomorphaceae bacterium]|nr:hypothetical protein [Cryomorphaceae bacterium]
MKNTKSTLLGLLLFMSLVLTSCGGSVKGKWSDEDKKRFRKEMEGVSELANFGEDKEEWIECYLSKCEANFASFAEADKDTEGCERIAAECNEVVFSNGSVKGNWSDEDKQKFRSEMEGIPALSNFGDKKSVWIECYLSKCEATFDSFYKANLDQPGCEKIALECTEDMY